MVNQNQAITVAQ